MDTNFTRKIFPAVKMSLIWSENMPEFNQQDINPNLATLMKASVPVVMSWIIPLPVSISIWKRQRAIVSSKLQKDYHVPWPTYVPITPLSSVSVFQWQRKTIDATTVLHNTHALQSYSLELQISLGNLSAAKANLPV